MRNQGKAFFLFFFFDNHECALNALIATFCLTVREKRKEEKEEKNTYGVYLQSWEKNGPQVGMTRGRLSTYEDDIRSSDIFIFLVKSK